MQYEGSEYFSYVIISTTSTQLAQVAKDIVEYIEKIKQEDVDKELFETIRRKKIGEAILESDSLSISYRRVIDSVLNNTNVYLDMDILNELTAEDVKEFLKQLNEDNRVTSKI